MRAHAKIGVLYLSALIPLCVIALWWSITGLSTHPYQKNVLLLAVVAAAAAARLRIHLPKTGSQLALSDVLVLFAVIYFGGEIAVILCVSAGISSAIGRALIREPVETLTNFCISIITVFVTSIGVLSLFGPHEALTVKLETWSFVLVTATLAALPFVLNTLLASAHLAIRGKRRYWEELRSRAGDAVFVNLFAALMAGLGAMAIRDTNVFLFVSIAAFFGILQVAFHRYRADYMESRRLAAKSEHERSKLAEKHIAELKHYIGEMERSSQALRDSREKYRHAAYHDSLTGLPNRNQIAEIIERLTSKAQFVNGFQFALLYIDLLRFKTINDSLGHSMGDQLISHVASRLSTLAGNGETIGRFSGDEFAILIPEISSTDEAIAFGEKVAEMLAQPFVLDHRQIFTGVSMGIAIGSSKYNNAADLLRDADIAMYRAKERKRSIVVFEDKMHVQAVSLMQLETDLRLAVERNEFELFYQPIVDLDSTRLAGVEALVRWSHPEFGHINPDKFIDVSEATGLIIPMTLQILESACLQLKRWNQDQIAGAPLFASINLSGTHFTHPDVVAHIEGVLQKTGVDPRMIKLEITETAVMDNAERAATVLKRIKDLGVQISIDDFGTGYSSLSYLQRFPIDTLKIDRSFVRSMEDGRQNGEIVRTILALADAMKLSVVAEGIESVHQLHQLRILNCRYGQGYLFSHPLPVAEIAGLLNNPSRWETLVSGSNFSIVPPEMDIPTDERVH
jgi:diguanylate cyclase (GGDEF)-like protein